MIIRSGFKTCIEAYVTRDAGTVPILSTPAKTQTNYENSNVQENMKPDQGEENTRSQKRLKMLLSNAKNVFK